MADIPVAILTAVKGWQPGWTHYPTIDESLLMYVAPFEERSQFRSN
jgi:hypothetical protein